MIFLAASNAAVATVWAISLAVGIVVVVVVGFLLHLVVKTARRIEYQASAIWTEGKLVANNTIQIPLFLHTTNRIARRILDTAGQVSTAVHAIEDHADECPGCPACTIHKHR